MRSSSRALLFLSGFNQILNVSTDFVCQNPMAIYIRINPTDGAMFLHEDKRTDGRQG